jgi:hypothetical protein
MLKRTFPGEAHNQVSHETIYRSLFILARGVLRKELLEHLRARRTIRRSRHASMKQSGLGQTKDAVSIRERPASVEDRAVPAHWEGDLIGGSKNSYVATPVERHSRYLMPIKVANKDAEGVVTALIKHSQKLPRQALSVTDLGPWQRACRSSTAEAGHRHRDLLLRSAITLAAGLERKHQPVAAPVSAARAQTSLCTAKPSSTPGSSTSVRESPCSIKHQGRGSPSVLQRSVEPTANGGHRPPAHGAKISSPLTADQRQFRSNRIELLTRLVGARLEADPMRHWACGQRRVRSPILRNSSSEKRVSKRYGDWSILVVNARPDPKVRRLHARHKLAGDAPAPTVNRAVPEQI